MAGGSARSLHRWFGALDTSLRGTSPSYSEWFVDRLVDTQLSQIYAAVAGDVVGSGMVEEAVGVIVAQRSLIDRQAPRLAHGDFSPSNLLVLDGRLTGIIDWEGTLGAPRANDFAWWSSVAQGPLADLTPLLKGYGVARELNEDFPAMLLLAQLRIRLAMFVYTMQVNDTEGYRSSRQSLYQLLHRTSTTF